MSANYRSDGGSKARENIPLGERSDPHLVQFYRDMNEHGGCTYRRVAPRFVIELDYSLAWLTVWAAVEHPSGDGYAKPTVEGNSYAWDALARREGPDKETVAGDYDYLTTPSRVLRFVDDFEYDGPRRPYPERLAQAQGGD